MCGILGYCARQWDPGLEKFFGLQGFNLQHRGQENFGATYSNGKKFSHFKDRGLVSQVVAREETLNAALALADEVAGMPPLAVRAAKESVNRAYELSLEAGLEFERRNFFMLFASDDQKEGMAAFVEKRKPTWKGR